MEEIRFEPTGDFWIDNGIVSLFSSLNTLKQEGELQDIEINQDIFSISGERKDLEEALHNIVEDAMVSYKRKTGNYGIYYNKEKGKLKVYEKETWKLYVVSFIGIRPSPSEGGWQKYKVDGTSWGTFIKEHPDWKGGRPEKVYLSPLELSLKTKINLRRGRTTCSFCGEKYKTTDLAMNLYPLLVDRQRMATFYGGWDIPLRICSKCVVVSRMAPKNCLYHILDQENVLIFYIHASSLRNLGRAVALAGQFVPTDKREAQFTNYRIDMGKEVKWRPRYLNENLLTFLFTIFLRELGGADKNVLADMKWIGFHVNSGGMVTYRGALEFDRTFELYNHFNSMMTMSIDLPAIVANFWYLREGEKPERATVYREMLAERILKFKDISPVIEMFMYESNRIIYKVIDMVKYYATEVLKMNEEDVDKSLKIGAIVGSKAYEMEKAGKGGSERILFEIRNARKQVDLYNALNRSQFNLNVRLDEDIIKRIESNPKEWEKYKLFISIAAKNAYEVAKWKGQQTRGE